MTPIQTAIEFIGTAKAAALLGIAAPSVCKWTAGQRPVPAQHCPAIERATEGRVRCEDLCPDLVWNRDENGEVTSYSVPIKDQQAK